MLIVDFGNISKFDDQERGQIVNLSPNLWILRYSQKSAINLSPTSSKFIINTKATIIATTKVITSSALSINYFKIRQIKYTIIDNLTNNYYYNQRITI